MVKKEDFVKKIQENPVKSLVGFLEFCGKSVTIEGDIDEFDRKLSDIIKNADNT